jgi:hypothetical protein
LHTNLELTKSCCKHFDAGNSPKFGHFLGV